VESISLDEGKVGDEPLDGGAENDRRYGMLNMFRGLMIFDSF
jgi:hypothetical protein